MSLLTEKQEAFCIAYVQSGDASAAYRAAGYSPRMRPKTVNEEACRLLKNPKVTARLAELRAPAAELAQVNLRSHLADLLWLREQAASQRKYSAAVQAEIARGRVAGLYVEKTEVFGELALSSRLDMSSLSAQELEQMEALLLKVRSLDT